jgi:methionyl-tRNA formyltransferase
VPRLTILSMPCREPVAAVAALLAEPGIEVASLLLAGDGEGESGAARVAREAGVRVVQARSYPQVRGAVQADAPDLVVAICFPWRLRRDVLDLPRKGVANIHPSLLPGGRGPEPVFWTFRNGERETGVTVHLMDEGLDTGPILAQCRMPMPPEMTAPDLEAHLLETGARLLVDLLPGLLAGSFVAIEQDHAAATHAPVPAAADWLMPASLPAGWASRFARAVAPLDGPLAVFAGGQIIPVGAPVTMDDWDRPDHAVEDHADGTVTVRFSPGWVRFLRAASGGEQNPARLHGVDVS